MEPVNRLSINSHEIIQIAFLPKETELAYLVVKATNPTTGVFSFHRVTVARYDDGEIRFSIARTPKLGVTNNMTNRMVKLLGHRNGHNERHSLNLNMYETGSGITLRLENTHPDEIDIVVWEEDVFTNGAVE